MRDDQRTLGWIMRDGRTSTAFQALGEGLRHWFDDDGRGMVAYADTGRAWVAAGEPIASPGDAIGVAERFVAAASARGRRSVFFASEGVLATSPRLRRTLIGEQPEFDPRGWSDSVRGHRSMREQLRRARAKGVRVRAVTPAEVAPGTPLRAAIDALVSRWLAARTMARMRFIVDVAPLANLPLRRIHVAERIDDGAQVVALLSMVPVPARKGWLLEHLLRDPHAPNGTAELLVDGAMRALAAEDVRWATLGLAPLSGPVDGWLRAAREVSRPLFNFRGLSAFKRKLRPASWAPIYLAYPRERGSVGAMWDGLHAFAGESLARFALRTAMRGPRPLLHALEVSLVPWTIALALVPTRPWFPSALVHWSWVAFDVALVIALRRVRMRGTPGLARGVAMAVTFDAAATIVQALAFTIPEARRAGMLTPVALAAIIVACVGPLVAAPPLWGAARRLGVLRHGPRGTQRGTPRGAVGMSASPPAQAR